METTSAASLSQAIAVLIDEAGGNEKGGHRIDALVAVMRTEIRRLNAEDVGPVPKGTPARRGWALTPDGFARALHKLTTTALGARASGLSVDAITAALRERMSDMDVDNSRKHPSGSNSDGIQA